jgi:hypothetical protein
LETGQRCCRAWVKVRVKERVRIKVRVRVKVRVWILVRRGEKKFLKTKLEFVKKPEL